MSDHTLAGRDYPAYVRSQLSTRKKWLKVDYEDFYERDVTQLLAEVERLRDELTAAHAVLDEAGVPRESSSGPWPLERRIRLLLAWWQDRGDRLEMRK